MLAVSPYESHHDARFFHPNPEDYNPTREGLQCPDSNLHEVPGIGGIAGLVFGGGRYRCTSLYFALLYHIGQNPILSAPLCIVVSC